jgi:prepilin-type N-terminal cleavage/methylation domain-containing protein
MFTKPAFSLIELLIVISVVSLLLIFGLPSFYYFRQNLSLATSAKMLASTLRETQAQAFLIHQTCSLSCEALALPAEVQVVSDPGICFSSSGFPPPGGSGTIIIANQLGKEKRIIVSSVGRVRIE